MNESDPFERNWARSSNSRTGSERLAADSRMKVIHVAAAEVDHHAVGDARGLDLRPLLQLHDDGCVADRGVAARDHHVEALGQEGELELDEDSPGR